MVVQESLRKGQLVSRGLRLSHSRRGPTCSCATQPTLTAEATSTTTVLYVDSVPQKKELASTSFGHISGRFADVWLGTFAMLSRAIGSLVGHENTRR